MQALRAVKLHQFLLFAVASYATFGFGLLLIPVQFTAIMGVTLDPGGTLVARVLGSSLVAFMLIFWWNRHEAATGTMLTVLRASFVYNAIDLPFVVLATTSGVMNAVGLLPITAHLLLAVGFGYFGFMQQREVAAATS